MCFGVIEWGAMRRRKNLTGTFLGFLAFLIILGLSASIMFTRFPDPWTRVEDANSLIYSYHAKNLLRYPIGLHKFLNLFAVSNPPQSTIVNQDFSYYLDHSPILTYFVAGSYLLFGINEPAARLIPMLSSLGSLITIFYFARKIGDRRW